MKKRTKSTQQFNLTQQAVLAAIICGAFNQAQALPMGEQVQAGSVNFIRDGQSLNINQFSQKAIVNWQSFDITANEAVRLNQPNQGSALFRVLGSDPSQIFGSLTATGRLFLINPNGVLFGRGARVDVGGLVATTMRMNDADFLSGNYRFFTNPNDPLGASVVNQGVIRATDGGYLVLLGETVENSGTLEANRGSVVLGSAQSAMLDFYGDGLVRVKLDGDALKAAINNTGSIHADGGAVQLATNARTAAINVDGVIQANSLVNRNGVIRLEGGKNAKVSVSGTLSAASNEAGTTGGRVEVTGEQVALFKGAKLDASGDAGGGTALVGGDYQGKSTQVYNSRTTYADKDTSINVDAKNKGNGGKAIVWSDDTTRYYGNISAKGGVGSGGGGFVEVSGKHNLDFVGKVNLSASNGVGGKFLLDPTNITLNTSTQASPPNNANGTPDIAFGDAPANTIVQISDITGFSEAFFQATNDITIANALTMAAGNSIRLEANNNINVNAAVTTTGAGAITFKADADANGTGDMAIGANNIASQVGGITLSGVNISKTTGTIVSTGAASANAGNVNITATGAANLGTGAIAANGGAGAAATAGGNAGNITITAAGAIATGAVTATGGAAGAGNAAGGNAGTINISTTVGNITTGALATQTGAATGTGAGGAVGSITVNNTAAAGNVTVGALTTTGAANGNAGNINVSGTGLLTLNGAIAANGGANVAATTQVGKNAGNITLAGNAGITNAAAATINANGGAGLGTDQVGGNAGVVSLASLAGAISSRAINAQTGAATGIGAGGAVGSITLNGASVTTNAGALTTTGAANGNGGNINVTTTGGTLGVGAIVANGGGALAGTTGRNAGNVTLNAANTITATSIAANGSAGVLTGDQAGGNSGVISVTGVNGVTTTTLAANGGAAAGTNANGGNAGSITIGNSGTGNIITTAINANTGTALGTGVGGTQGFVFINNTSVAGNIATGAISAAGNANGHGGNVTLTGNNAVTVTGALNTNGGAATGTRVGRNAGNVTITGVDRSVTGAITANGGAGIGAAQAGGNAGLVSITGTGTLTTAAINAQTGAATTTGTGGAVGGITLNGTTITTGALTTTGVANGNAGNIGVTSTTGNMTVGAVAANAGGALAGVAGRNAGAVVLNSAGTVTATTIAANGSAGNGATLDLAGGNAAAISITGVGGITATAIGASGGTATTTNASGGNAGAITIANSGTGNIGVTTLTSQTGAATGTGAGGTAGGVSVTNTAAGGTLTTTTINTSGGAKGQGGNVILSALGAVSTTNSNISTSGGAGVASAGRNAGTVTISGAGVNIGTGAISASGSAGNGADQAGGNGAAIQITSTNGVTATGTMTANGGNGVATNAAGGNAGSISILNNTVGDIATGALTARTGVGFGTGANSTQGFVTVNNTAAAGAVTTAAIDASGQADGNGGNVIVSSFGASTTGAINTSGGASTGIRAGRIAGNVGVTGATVTIGAITANGAAGIGLNQAGGNAGTVSLTATTGAIVTQAINAIGGAGVATNANGGNGGAVALDAGAGSTITMTNITTTGGNRAGTGTAGAGGNILVADNALLSADTTITATGGSAGVGTGGTVSFGGTINSQGANRALTINTSAATTLSGAIGDSLALTSLTTNATGTTAINGGSVTTTGAQTYNDAVTLGAATTFTTINSAVNFANSINAAGNGVVIAAGTGAVTAANAANNFANLAITAGSANIRDTDAIVLGATNVTGAYALQTNGAITQTAGVTVGGATTLNAGAANDITLNNVANNFNTVAVTSGRDVNLADANALTVNASTVRKMTAQTLSGDLTLGGAISATGTGSGTSINLVSAGNFLNPGNSALTPGAGSRWLVYSTNPTQDTRGAGLLAAYNFKQYNTAFGGPILGTGNGFIYTVAPTITPTLTGSATKTYNGTIAAPIGSLALGNVGAIDGDSVVLVGLSSATYDTANAGTGKTVSANGISLTSANNAGKAVFGYQLASTTATGAVGTINKANLIVSTGNVTKTYDGTLAAAGAATVTSGTLFNNASNGGALDSLSGGTFTYTNANAGTGNKTVTVGGVTVNDGNGGGNYNVTFANNTTSTINKANITVSTSDVVKTYDGTLAAAGTTNVTSGALFNNASNGGAADTLSGGTFAYTNKDFGIGNKTVTVGGVAVNDGNGGGNYNVTFANNTTSTINKANLAIDAVTDTKTYDGTTTSAGVVNVGTLFGTDTVTGATQAFASKNALGVNGSTLNVTGFTLNDGNGGNNYTVTTNAAAGTINSRAITVSSATDTKIYDGTISSVGAPTVTSGAIVAGDTGSFSQTFNNKNAGTGKILTSTGSVTDGNGGNNYAVTFVANNTGVINQANLTVTAQTDSRVYDGTINSAVAPIVTGTLFDAIGTAATQSYDNRNAGTGKTLTASGLVVNDGNGGNNYAVNYVNSNTGVITKANLTVTAQTDNRVYDGTTNSAAAPVVTGTLFDAIGTAATQSYDNRNAGTGKTLTASGLAVNDGNGGNNYAVSYVNNNTGVITPRAIRVTSSTDTKVYDGTTNSVGAPTVTLGSIVAGDSGNFNQTFDNKNAGTGKTLTSAGGVTDGNGSNNYAVTFVADNTGVINQRALTVTANPGQSKIFGAADPLPFTFSVGGLGLVGGDTLTGALDRISGETVGSYAINQGTLAASPNYLFTYIGNNFSIFAPIVSGGGSNDPRSAAGLVDLNPALGNYTNQQLFVLNVGFTAAGNDSANQEACEAEPEKLAKDKDFILMLNYGLKLPKGVNASCDKHSGDKT